MVEKWMIAECLHYSAVYFETLNITISDNRKKDPSRSDKSPKLAQIRRICPKDKRFDVNLLVFFITKNDHDIIFCIDQIYYSIVQYFLCSLWNK